MTWSRLAFAMTLLILAAVLPASASAATPELLWQSPENGLAGSGAGQIDHASGIVADPVSGHVFVLDSFNARIDEFDAWGEFVKAWGWGVRNGAGELQTCGPGATPPSATCLAGIEGYGPGQIGSAHGLTRDSAGDIYVVNFSSLSHRVQKFDPEGHFLLMFGREVDEGPNHPGNICTAAYIAEGDNCGAGKAGEGDGEFEQIEGGQYIAVGPAGTIFVGDANGRIQEFEPSGAFKSKVILEDEFGGRAVQSLAIDGAGDFYVVGGGFSTADYNHIYKFSSTGALLSTINVKLTPESPLALDPAGNLYAVGAILVDTPTAERVPHREVIEFAPDGAPIIPAGSGFAVQEGKWDIDPASPSGIATNTVTAGGGVDVYVTVGSAHTTSFASSYGPPPEKWLPPMEPPEITSQYAASVDADGALLRAQINPRFWKDTSYYVEWGTGKCSEGGCTQQQPAPPGFQLGAGVISRSVTSKGVSLSGLTPLTTYHYRFVAQSSGGGPVRGVGGKVGADGPEGIFTTSSLPSPPNLTCANAPLRAGSSAFLPDCRAYEMVSPVDKNGGDVVGVCNTQCFRAEMNQASLDGGKFTYSSYKAFGDAVSNPYSNQYMASRGADGWSTHGISPPYASGLPVGVGFKLDVEFRAFSADLSSAWLIDTSRLPLTSDAVSGFTNAYRQDTSDGSLTALTTVEPKLIETALYKLLFEGGTPDGEHVLLVAPAALTPDAAAGSNQQLYEAGGGVLHLVSVLPDGTANPSNSVAGTSYAGDSGFGEHGSDTLSHAISDDGSRVFWSSYSSLPLGQAKLYVRVNAEQAQSARPGGKCTQPAKACTYAVSGGPAQFWTANPGGSEALFSENEDLFRFDTSAKAATLIAHKALGVLGASEDLSRIYFVSKESLAPGAVAGERNLYLDEKGAMTYIATLSDVDTYMGNSKPSNLNPRPLLHATRVSADGLHLVFMSTNSLTGYDNTDANNGKADSEIFSYDAEAAQLTCISCNPTGARPHGGELKYPYSLLGSTPFNTGQWGAAWINTSEYSFYSPRALSEDGTRLFFNSFDPLVSRDTNGAQDVYQWEVPGSGDCTVEAASFSAANGGCLSLISSGESPEESEFVDATPDGSDVFFKTAAGLDPRDPGLIDVYDARVGGGFAPPPVPAPPCLGDACQSVPAAPNDSTPASAAFKGAGNPSARKPSRSCRARKGQSTKAKRQAKRKQAKPCKHANRRAGR